MKVLVLNGSPKKRSDTFRLTDAFLKGLNKTKEHEVNIIHVIEKEAFALLYSWCREALVRTSSVTGASL